MNRYLRALGRLFSARTVATLVGCLLVTVGLGIGLGRLDFATGQNSYIDPASKVAKDNERYQNLFGGENMIVLFTVPEGKTVVDLFDTANVEAFKSLEADLQKDPSIASVVSPLSLLTWTQDMVTKGVATEILTRTTARETDPAAIQVRQKDLTITALRLGAAGQQTFDNPAWLKFLIFGNDGYTVDASGKVVEPTDSALVVRKPLQSFIRDARHVLFAALLVGNASLDQQAAGSKAVKEAVAARTFDNATVTVTGTPTFLTDINDYLQGGMFTLGLIAVGVMVIILLLTFGVRWRLLPLLGMLVGVAWGFGAFGFTGTKLSLVTIAGLPILIGLGIEFAIQMQNRIEEERAVDRSGNIFGETMVTLGPPLLVATVAAVIAFLTVKISKVPMVRDFGVLLSIGIVALLVAGVVLPTAIIGARERRRPSTRSPGHGWAEAVVRTLGGLPRLAVLPLVALAVVTPVLGLALEKGTHIESDPINWADQSSRTIKNARLLEQETRMATTLGVFVETDSAPSNGVFTDQMGAFVTSLVARSEAQNEELVGASSLATTVGWLTDVPGAPSLPPTGLDMLQAYQVAPPVLQETLVADDGNAAQVLLQVGPSSLEQRKGLLERVERTIAVPDGGAPLPANTSATTGGLAVVGVGLLENITANRSALTIVALLLVGAFVVLVHRDLVRGLLTMIPVLLAVGSSALLVRVLDITLSPLTTVSGPLVVATCAEFSVLLVARYAEERRRGLDPEESTRVAAQRTGRAFFTSALTTLGGFAVLMFSPLPLLADFGMVVTVNIGVAVLSALVLVPPLVKAADHAHLLAMGDEAAEARTEQRWRAPVGWLAALALAAGGVALTVAAARSKHAAALSAQTAQVVEAPATIPTTTLPPATTAPPAGSDTVPANSATTLPPGPPERPAGLVGGAFWDGLTAAGVDPGIARCAADDLLATTPEAQLLAMGIASSPRPDAVNALLDAAATRCGVTRAQLDKAAGAGAG